MSSTSNTLNSFISRSSSPAAKSSTRSAAAKPAPDAEGIAPPAQHTEPTTDDMLSLIYAEVNEKGVAAHHLESMNSFFTVGIKQIVTKIMSVEHRFKNDRDSTETDKEIAEIAFKVTFEDVKLKQPATTFYRSGKPQMQTPNMSRLQGLTYSCPVNLDLKAEATAFLRNGTTKVIEQSIRDLKIAMIPCMVKSCMCVTHNMPTTALKNIEEDPRDPGGYFIIKGNEWVISNLENVNHNEFNVFKNAYQNEIARGTILSKPGDGYENSYQMIIRYVNTGAITIEITTGKLEKLHFPFYVMFRALGMTSDREITDNIVYGVERSQNGTADSVTTDLLNILEQAFDAEDEKFSAIKHVTNRDEIIKYIVRRTNEGINASAAEKDDNAMKHLINQFLSSIDKMFLPHIGQTPDARIRKLRFLGHLINNLLTVALQITDPTDRDSYGRKRITPAGTSLAKTFKTDFNKTIVRAIKTTLHKAFQENQFSKVNLEDTIRGCIRPDVLEKMLTQSITTGGSTTAAKKGEPMTRISSQQLYHKNHLNVISTLRTIDTPNTSASKQNERADEMRRVHPASIGFVGVSQSADTGEKVGMTKQMAITASICMATSSFSLKDTLAHDEDIITLDKVTPSAITTQKLAKIFVNGDWIGCATAAHVIAAKYRKLRREGKIHHLTTIVWKILVREVYFWVDANRMQRPVTIVYNNLQEYIDSRQDKKSKVAVPFKQWHLLSREIIEQLRSQTITMEELRLRGIIEYISPDEQENAYIAMNMDVFRSHSTDITHRYTHIDAEQAIFGIITNDAPLANHSNATRVTYYTNHRKQSAGWFTLNYPYRIDKNTTLQWYCEMPLIATFTNSLTLPNGMNPIVALMVYGGSNMEDSTIINQSSIDCGLFNASHYYFEKTDLEKGEEFRKPDLASTLDTKNAIYEYIKGEAIEVGTVAHKGYALIAKVAKLDPPKLNYTHTDKSVIYRRDEPAVVERVVNTRNDEDERFVKVKLRSTRHLTIGDKMSSRTGNKGICGKLYYRSDMPYDDEGVKPDIIVNPHSIPTRMAINQLLECLLGKIAAKIMAHIDASPLKVHDWDSVFRIADQYGIKDFGHRRFYNGFTGEPMIVQCFVGPTTYQRIQKFIIDENYAIRSGPKSAITNQPVDGKNNDGGLRLGEMEKDCLAGHGCMGAFAEKFHHSSDGEETHICRNCGNRAIVNEQKSLYRCRTCGDRADIYVVNSTRCANVLMDECAAMGVKMSLVLEPHIFPRVS